MRYDSLISTYPDQRIGGPGWPYAPEEIFFPSRSTPGYEWKDITPRVGVAYDLFGNGKTAIRFNIGKYLEAITASNNDLDMNPITRMVVNSTRGWTDADRDFVPDCDLMNRGQNGECAPLDNQNLGLPVFTRTFDPDYVGGWGTRPYNWSIGLGVQHEVVPRVSATVTYNRNWWGNWYVVDNRATSAADYTPFSILAPLDPRLPGGGGTDDQRAVQPRAGQGRAGGRARAILQELRGSDRELAGRGRLGCGAAPERAHGAGGHEHRAQARGRLRRAGAIAGAGLQRHGAGDEQLRDGERQCPRGRPIRPLGEEPLLPHRGTLPNGLPGTRVVPGPESGRAGVRDVGEHPRGLAAGGLHRDQCVDCRGAAAARPAAHRGRHCLGEPDPAGHAVGRAA